MTQRKQILNYDTLSARYINDSGLEINQGDIVVYSHYLNNNIYVKLPSAQGDSFVFGVALDKSLPDQPVQLAQLGYAKIRVDTSNGPIVVGDKIATKGGNTGIGIKWTSNIAKSLVAFALEDFNDAQPGLVTCKVLFNVSEAIIPSTATGEYITGTTFTIGYGHDNDENEFFRILFGDQTAGDSYISWDGTSQRFSFGGDVVFEGSQFLAFDEIIELNADAAGPPSANCGLEVNRGSETNAQLLWNETTDRWEIGLVGNLHKVLTEEDLDGGAGWSNALQGDLLVGKTGGGGMELYHLSGTEGDVLLNSSGNAVWGQIAFTEEGIFTVGKNNTVGRIEFVDALSSFGKSSGSNNVIFSSYNSGGDLLKLISLTGLESDVSYSSTGSSDFEANLINTEVTALSNAINVYGLRIKSQDFSNVANNLYGLYVDAPIGAVNNYSAFFGGHVYFNSTIYSQSNTSTSFVIGSGTSLSGSDVYLAIGNNSDFKIGYLGTEQRFGVVNSVLGTLGNKKYSKFYNPFGYESDVVFEVMGNGEWNNIETIGNKFKVGIDNSSPNPPEYPNSILYNVYLDEIAVSAFDVQDIYNLYVKDVFGATVNNYSAYFEGKVKLNNALHANGSSSSNGIVIGGDFVLYNASGSGQIETTTSDKNITITPHGNGKVFLSKVVKFATYTDGTEPASGIPGDFWYNSTTKVFRTFDVDGITKRDLAFVGSESGSNYVYTNTIQDIIAQKTFRIPIASTVSNFTGTAFTTNINSGVSVSGELRSVEILRSINGGPASTNNIGNYYSLYVGSPKASDWTTRTATTAIGLYVEGTDVSSSVTGNWAAQFGGRVRFNNASVVNTSTDSFASFIFETTQSANIGTPSIVSATTRIGAPTVGGTANTDHFVASLYLNAPLVTNAKNRSIYAEGSIESDNFIVSLPSNLNNLNSGHMRAGGTSIGTINNIAHYHTLYANNANGSANDGGSLCLSPYFNIANGFTEALVNIRPYYGVGNNPNMGLRIFTVGSGTSYIGMANPASSSSIPNSFNDANAVVIKNTSSGLIFDINSTISNRVLVFKNNDSTYSLNTAFEGGVVVGSETPISERYLVLSNYSANPSGTNNGAIYYNSSDYTIKAQVFNGSNTVNKTLEFKIFWETDNFEFYETGYSGSTTGKINIDSQTYVDLVHQPADADAVIFKVKNAGSQLLGFDYTVNISGSNKRVTFMQDLIDEIKLAANATDTVKIQVVYARRDSGT